MIKCRKQNEDGKFWVTKSVGKEINYNHDDSKFKEGFAKANKLQDDTFVFSDGWW